MRPLNKTLIVNIGFSPEFIEATFTRIKEDSGGNSDVIDFSGKNYTSGNFKIIPARILDENNAIEKHSIRDFTFKIGKLSLCEFSSINKPVREICINGLPIFWITRTAEKHPFDNWLYNLCFFKNFLIEKKELFQKYREIIVLLPYEYGSSPKDSLFFEDLDAEVFKNVKFQGRIKPSFSSFRFLARLMKFCSEKIYLSQKTSKSPSLSDEPARNLILNILGTPNSPIHDFILKTPSNIKTEALVLPAVFKDRSELGDFFRSHFPAPARIISLCKNIYECFQFCKEYYEKELRFDIRLILHEIIHAIGDFNLLLLHSWLTNSFRLYPSGLKVFYEDEMYRSGRIISHSILLSGNKNITSYGYQHGNISESHTVYRFSEDEISDAKGARNGVPLPDYFLVWGNYFKKQFLETSNINPERIIVAGNLAYINMPRIHEVSKVESLNKILWCTTNLEFALQEFKLFSGWLEKEGRGKELIIRMHPRFNIKDELIKEFGQLTFNNIRWDTNKSLYDTLKEVDIVIGSAHSTIFIDAIIFQKPVMRLFNKAIFNDEITGSGLQVKNIASPTEFEEEIKDILKLSDVMVQDYLYLKDDVWKEIMNKGFKFAENAG